MLILVSAEQSLLETSRDFSDTYDSIRIIRFILCLSRGWGGGGGHNPLVSARLLPSEQPQSFTVGSEGSLPERTSLRLHCAVSVWHKSCFLWQMASQLWGLTTLPVWSSA